MIDDWRRALDALSTEPARLAPKRPPGWWFTTNEGQILATVDANGAVAIEIPARESWPSLVVLDRAQALATRGALETGDAHFDRAVAVFCDDPMAIGLLDEGARPRLRELVARGGCVLAGSVCMPAAHDPVTLDDALAVARALALSPAAAREQLVAIAASDHDPDVRERFDRLAHAYRLLPDEAAAVTRNMSFDRLAAQLIAARGTRATRMQSLATLLEQHDVAAIAALQLPWDAFVPDRGDTVAAALVGAFAHDPSPTLDLVQMIYAGRLDELPDELAEALIELLPLAMTTASLAKWFQLARHRTKRLALFATQRLGSLPEGIAPFAAALRDPELRDPLARDDDLASHLLTVAISRYEDASDDDRQVTRRLVRTYGGRHVLAARTSFTDAWPAAQYALTMIDAHHTADDPEGAELYRMLVEHDDVQVRRRALVMLLDLPTAEPLPSSALVADIVAAALDPSAPRHAGKVLVRHFPHNNRASELTFLAAFARVGTAEHVTFLMSFIDADDSAIVCRALDAIGNIADPSVVPKLKPLTTGFFRDGDVKDAASAAIEAIQARGAPRGALSMSDAGGLALDD